ncbi:hypothetical protein MRB53_041615 [Persea americana]|nr:hypothetical protein MRB53_041615 [Persea americana]
MLDSSSRSDLSPLGHEQLLRRHMSSLRAAAGWVQSIRRNEAALSVLVVRVVWWRPSNAHSYIALHAFATHSQMLRQMEQKQSLHFRNRGLMTPSILPANRSSVLPTVYLSKTGTCLL